MEALPPPKRDADLVVAFAHRSGLDMDALFSMFIASLAAQLRAGAPLPLPLQVGLPSVQCMACPFSSFTWSQAGTNIVTFPRHT